MNIIFRLIRYFPSPFKVFFYRMLSCKIGRNVLFSFGSLIVSEQVEIADNVKLGRNCKIVSRRIKIGRHTGIGAFSNIRVSENLDLGANSNYGIRTTAYCRELKIGDFMHACSDIDFGYSSPTHDSKINIGEHCFLGNRTIINSERSVNIGNDVAIGAESMIWTHGSWLSVLDGFSATFAPVKIGNKVWIPARTVILPGVEIGNDVVISINSVVTRSIPSGAVAAGNPAKIIAEKMYPKTYTIEKKASIIKGILEDYIPVLLDKGFAIAEDVDSDVDERYCMFQKRFKKFSILLYTILNAAAFEYIKKIEKRALVLFFISEIGRQQSPVPNVTYFDLSLLKIFGTEDEISEDMRDYLRRRSIKIFTKNRFCSIKPIALRKLE